MMRKRKARASTSDEAPSPVPNLPDEIVVDQILVRLPVKSLLRFRSVCKAWRAIISDDPVFIRAHLSARCDDEQDPPGGFLITPLTLDDLDHPTGSSIRFRFYQWRQGDDDSNKPARLMHDFAGEFNRIVHDLGHCDGLVLASTDTKMYLFNPATRDAITLPDSERNDDPRCSEGPCHHGGAGLGRDPRTGEYKVVRPFFRSVHAGFLSGVTVHVMGMEVLTVGSDGVWRETTTRPPYPVTTWSWPAGAAVHIKGFMYWLIDEHHHEPAAPRGFLRLSLADERFDVVGLPDPALDGVFSLYVLRGEELCLTSQITPYTGDDGSAMAIWTMKVDDDGGQGQWERHHNIRSRYPCRPMALVAGGSRLLLQCGSLVYGHDLAKPEDELTTVYELDRIRYQQGRRRRGRTTWNNLWTLNVVTPYRESLVRPRFHDTTSSSNV